MPRKSKGWKNRGRKNRGWFRPGSDPRRHRLTNEEKKQGGAVFAWLYCHHPAGAAWSREAKFFARLQVGLGIASKKKTG
jgi:hypothetical protein